VTSACQQLSTLHRLIDGVALLDMLAAIALAVSPSLRDIMRDCSVSIQATSHCTLTLFKYRELQLLQVQERDGTYVRPQLTENGPMAIVEGRHPLVEQLIDVDYQANDTYLSGMHACCPQSD